MERPFSRRDALRLLGAGATAALWPLRTEAQAPVIRTILRDYSPADLGGGATLFQGAGGNVVALPGPEGALLIDGGSAANADALLTAVREATKASRIHTLINTHWHPDQVGANEAVGTAGGVIFAHEKTKTMLSNTVYNAIGFTTRVPGKSFSKSRMLLRSAPRHL